MLPLIFGSETGIYIPRTFYDPLVAVGYSMRFMTNNIISVVLPIYGVSMCSCRFYAVG